MIRWYHGHSQECDSREWDLTARAFEPIPVSGRKQKELSWKGFLASEHPNILQRQQWHRSGPSYHYTTHIIVTQRATCLCLCLITCQNLHCWKYVIETKKHKRLCSFHQQKIASLLYFPFRNQTPTLGAVKTFLICLHSDNIVKVVKIF